MGAGAPHHAASAARCQSGRGTRAHRRVTIRATESLERGGRRSRMDGGCYGAEGARSHMRTCRTRGFTLIEILVVIVVIAVLASLVAPNVFTHVGEAKNVTAGSQIEMLGAALDAYRLDNGRYPTTAQGLAALWQAPAQDPRPASWNGPYLRKDVPLDPWGRPYAYKCPGEHTPAPNGSRGLV